MNDRELSHRWNIVVGIMAVLVGCFFFISHLMWRDVAELTKDTFEPFSLEHIPMSFAAQHRIMFALIGLSLALSGGLLAKDFFTTRGNSVRALQMYRSLRLWFIFLASLAITCSIFYHATVD